MSELERKVAFLEARLTALERRFVDHQHPSNEDHILIAAGPFEPLRISCTQSGLMVHRMYPVEWDETGQEYCWIGNENVIQIVLPVRATRPLACRLRLKPHPRVDLSHVSVQIGDERQSATAVDAGDGMVDLGFEVPATTKSNIDILITGINSIRPIDLGENSDDRILAARFFGAYLEASEHNG